MGTAVSVPQSRACRARSTSSASAPTASPAARASTPTSARGTSSAGVGCARSGRPPASRWSKSWSSSSILGDRGAAVAIVSARTATIADRAVREARRFAGALEHAAAARAVAQRNARRHPPTGARCRFWRRDAANDRWQPVDDDDVLRRARCPTASTRRAVALRRPARSRPTPSCRCARAGRNEPFAFVVADAGMARAVAADPLNRVAITGPSALAP